MGTQQGQDRTLSTQQKQAWFLLATLGLACVGWVVLGLVVGFAYALGAFGICGLGGFVALIGRGGKPDERDRSINRVAALAAGMASYMAFLLGCMGTWAVAFMWQHQEQVSVHFLAAITGVSGGVFWVAWSVTILILYGRTVEADHV